MGKIDVHADDFGESVHASQDILDCLAEGKLDSISVLSNMSCFERCAALYRQREKEFPKKPRLSVHLNFMEGSCLERPEMLPSLVDGEGHFCISWGKLFLASWLPGRRGLKEQLKREMKLQIDKVKAAFPEIGALRLDSHQHTHMIPVVASALFEVLEENGWQAEYIRDAREPVLPFLKEISLYKTYRPVNFIKNGILNFCSRLMEGKLRGMGLEPMYLWGLVMSGNMDRQRVEKLLPGLKRAAEKKGRTLEILFHPGQVQKGEISVEFSQKEAIEFHLSEGRQVEKDAVMGISFEGKVD